MTLISREDIALKVCRVVSGLRSVSTVVTEIHILGSCSLWMTSSLPEVSRLDVFIIMMNLKWSTPYIHFASRASHYSHLVSSERRSKLYMYSRSTQQLPHQTSTLSPMLIARYFAQLA